MGVTPKMKGLEGKLLKWMMTGGRPNLGNHHLMVIHGSSMVVVTVIYGCLWQLMVCNGSLMPQGSRLESPSISTYHIPKMLAKSSMGTVIEHVTRR